MCILRVNSICLSNKIPTFTAEFLTNRIGGSHEPLTRKGKPIAFPVFTMIGGNSKDWLCQHRTDIWTR